MPTPKNTHGCSLPEAKKIIAFGISKKWTFNYHLDTESRLFLCPFISFCLSNDSYL